MSGNNEIAAEGLFYLVDSHEANGETEMPQFAKEEWSEIRDKFVRIWHQPRRIGRVALADGQAEEVEEMMRLFRGDV